MESARVKFERTNSLDLPSIQQNKTNDEKGKVALNKTFSLESDIKTDKNVDTEPAEIPEIKDIYDYIYGNVQSKLEFYEKQQNVMNIERSSKTRTSVSEDTNEHITLEKVGKRRSSEASDSLNEVTSENGDAAKPLESESSARSSKTDLSVSDNILVELSPEATISHTFLNGDLLTDACEPEQQGNASEGSSSVSVTSVDDRKKLQSNQNLLNDREISCAKCQKSDYVNDRTDVLTEINANMKVELENVKQELKKEIAKNNELNYEIANIESALETYCKEAKSQKSTLASLYLTMKNYASNQKNDFDESYTYKRVKVIADYIETLKNKLGHQDRIIRNNFVENPYYTDIIIKHEAALRQLDEISKENHELKDESKRKAAEELEIIKELNRQKFQIENKCREIESHYKNEIASKEALIRSSENECKKQLDEYQGLLQQRDQELLKMQKVFEARIKNYKQELVVVYRKWKEQKLTNNTTN